MSLARLLKAFVPAAVLTASAALAAAADPADGRGLYHGSVPFAPGATRLPPSFSACARCHGGNGEGGREGSMRVPPLTWAALAEPRDGLPRFDDVDAVLRAIQHGDGRGGSMLNPVMPRFSLTGSEATELLSFLHRVGTSDDQPAGVTKQEIGLGTLLPLSGPAGPAGKAVLAGLNDAFDAVNRDGGVFGRLLALRATDTADGVDHALQHLLDRPVFAVVGGLWPTRGALDQDFAARQISMLAPLAPKGAPAPADAWTVELLPSRPAQQAALAKSLQDCPAANERWALRLSSDDGSNPSQAVRWFDDLGQLRAALGAAPPAGCLGIDLAAASALRADIPATWQQRVVLPIPTDLLRPDGADGSPWRRLGRAAGKLAVELLSRSGAQLQERSPIEAAARLGDFRLLQLAAVRNDGGVFRGWEAEVMTVPPSQPVVQPGPLGAQGG